MMAACQPFLSGAISKTVNLEESATVEDIEKIYTDAYLLGLKSVAVYRNNCKKSQPINTKNEAHSSERAEARAAKRERLPDERESLTHKFSVAGHEGYVTVGKYPDGRPGEVYITMSKEGSTLSGVMNSLATVTSIALQYGVPLDTIVKKMIGTRFEPSGYTENKEIPRATSLVDYIYKWINKKFNSSETITQLITDEVGGAGNTNLSPVDSSAPPCSECGGLTQRSGSCHRCTNCGTTTGCS
jgi:ribonucleoside-diphosphate reductase alpha chain